MHAHIIYFTLIRKCRLFDSPASLPILFKDMKTSLFNFSERNVQHYHGVGMMTFPSTIGELSAVH